MAFGACLSVAGHVGEDAESVSGCVSVVSYTGVLVTSEEYVGHSIFPGLCDRTLHEGDVE